MTLRDFLHLIVRPNLAEFLAKPDDLRLAFNAVAAVDTLAAHMFRWALDNRPAAVAGLKDDDGMYRQRLATKNADFDLVFQVAKASKHVRLTRGKNIPPVRCVDQVTSELPTWDDNLMWDRFRWDVEQVFVRPDGGLAQGLEFVLVDALAFLEGEIAALGIP